MGTHTQGTYTLENAFGRVVCYNLGKERQDAEIKVLFWLMLGMEAWGRSMPYEVRGNLGGGGQEKGYGDNSDK